MKIICNNPFVEDVLLVCSVGQQVWLFLSFFLTFFCQNQGYSSYKIVLIQKKNVFASLVNMKSLCRLHM